MEPISLGLMTAAAGKVVELVLGDNANKLVSSLVGGVLGNRADRLVCKATEASWRFFRNLRTEDPALNHDLERGTREAYLLATLELLRQAEARMEADGPRLMTAGEPEALAALRRGAETDLADVANTLPEPVPDAHLFLVDPDLAPADRVERLRGVLRANLARDFERWLPGHAPPEIVDRLIESGWTLDTKIRKGVPRDWYSLIALAFVEKLKTTPRLATIFESRMLAQIALREPAAAGVGTFAGFADHLDRLTVPLQRIEDTLGILLRDVADIKRGVGDVKRDVGDVKRDVGRLTRALRTIRYRRDAFIGAVGGTVLVLLVAWFGIRYLVIRFADRLDADYRRLGYVTLTASMTAEEPALRVQARVWLLAEGRTFKDVRLITATRGPSGRVETTDHSQALNPAQAGGAQELDFQLPAATEVVTACLTMPHLDPGQRSRVTQSFAIPRGAQPLGIPVSLEPLADPRVGPDDGGPCAIGL